MDESAPDRAPRDAAIRAGSKSFGLAARLFDPDTRGLVWDLYTWCRHCDDVVDGQRFGHGRIAFDDRPAPLDALRTHTAAAFAGAANVSEPFAALARVVTATSLPAVLARDHLDGFAMDVEGRRYESFDDTIDYCYHVAGVVGLMMAWIMGVRDRSVLCRASDLGIAFQLSNIARDVGDDLRASRVYLPAEWLREAGVSMTAGQPLAAADAAGLVTVVARLLAEAERYYDSAGHGIPYLPGRSAWAVATARLVYRDIGRAVARRGAAAWTSRTVVGTPRKVARLAQAGLAVSATRLRRERHDAGAPRQGLFTPPTVAMLG